VIRRVSILCLSEDEKKRASKGLSSDHPVVAEGDYVTGYAEEDTLKRLADSGLIIKALPKALPEYEDALPQPNLDMVLDDDGVAHAPQPEERFVVSFNYPLGEKEMNLISASGGVLELRKSGDSYVMRSTLDQAHLVKSATDLVSSVSAYGPHATLARDMLQGIVAKSAARADDWTAPTSGAQGDDVGFSVALDDPGALGGGPIAPLVTLPIDVRCHTEADVPQVVAQIKAQPGFRSVEFTGNRIRCEIDAELGEDPKLAIGQMSGAAFAEYAVDPEPLLEFAVGALLRPIADAAAATFPLQGDGQMVAIADTGFDALHPDLMGRVHVVELATPPSSRDPHGHGTHVASIVAGDGAASGGKLAGVAPKAKVHFQSLAGATGKLEGARLGLVRIFKDAYDAGARVHNLSWGSEVASGYVMNSLELDEFVYQNPDHLVIVAAGNSGRQQDDGNIAFSSLTAPATAKNCLTVGACCSPRVDGPFGGLAWRDYPGDAPRLPPMADLQLTGDANVIAALSSRGPVLNGRMKPDVVAPGIGIAAARSGDSDRPGAIAYIPDPEHYTYKSGTSMATPMVAGAALLLREHLAQIGMTSPSAALMKAALINGAAWLDGLSAKDKTGQPNFHQGFGRLILTRVFPVDAAAGFALRLVDVASGSAEAIVAGRVPRNWSGKFKVEDNAAPLSITMTWTDPPGSGLVHELDLVVITPDGERLLGNDKIVRVEWEKIDRVNNVEQVRVDAPKTGEWTIRISGQNTWMKPQGFGLAVTGAVSDWI
jgi:subtilisin family serine protease